MDNYGTHKTKAIRDWFAKRPRWQAHFTPTSASWLKVDGPSWISETVTPSYLAQVGRDLVQARDSMHVLRVAIKVARR